MKKIDIISFLIFMVALVYILIGIASFVGMIIALTNKRIILDLNVICIFAGIGLLRRQPAWFKFATFYSGLYLVCMAISLPLFLILQSGFKFDFLWYRVKSPHAVVLSVLTLIANAAIFIILKLPKVRELFDEFKEPWGVIEQK